MDTSHCQRWFCPSLRERYLQRPYTSNGGVLVHLRAFMNQNFFGGQLWATFMFTTNPLASACFRWPSAASLCTLHSIHISYGFSHHHGQRVFLFLVHEPPDCVFMSSCIQEGLSLAYCFQSAGGFLLMVPGRVLLTSFLMRFTFFAPIIISQPWGSSWSKCSRSSMSPIMDFTSVVRHLSLSVMHTSSTPTCAWCLYVLMFAHHSFSNQG